MRTLLLLLFVPAFLTATANTYYFSSNSGNDSRSFSQAQNASTPWRSLQKLNAIFGSLKPGDKVLLKRGETFYGSITVQKSGTAGAPIVIGAYGSGGNPVITSLVRLTNWVSKGNGIYEASVSNAPSKLNIVLLNGVEQEEGRFPNSDAAGKGYLHYDKYGSNWISDNAFPSSKNWVGADVVIRSRRWILDRNPITSQSGSRISFKPVSQYKLRDDQEGYFLTNSIKTLDKLGEWYFNKSSKKIDVYFGKSPSSYSLQVSTSDQLIYCQRFSYVVFENLTIKGANSLGFSLKSDRNITISNCNIIYSGISGIAAMYQFNLKIENCTVSNSNNIGINLGYAGDNAVVRNNSVVNTALFPGMMSNGDGAGIGIHCNGNNNLLEYNQVRNTGYVGLVFNGNGTIIKNNFVDRFCLVKDDGAGIYSWSPTSAKMKNRKIIGNVVVNGIGESLGTRWPTGADIAEGIYMDNNAGGVDITDNTIGNCANQGLYCNNTSNITLKNNTFFNNRRQITLREMANHNKVRNIKSSTNIIFAKTTEQRLMYLESADNDIPSFGKFGSNHYARPKDNQDAKLLSGVKRVEPSARLLSVISPTRFEYNGTKSNKSVKLDASYVDVKGAKYSGNLVLAPFTSVVLIKSGPAKDNASPTVSITSPGDNTNFQTGTTINISANARDEDGSISKVEFYKGSTLLGVKDKAPYTYSWQNVQEGKYKITAKATDNSGDVTTSAGVDVSVTSSSKPMVSIATPATNTTYQEGALVYVLANAHNPAGSIKKVDLYINSKLSKTALWSPYDYSLKDLAPGNYQLTAKATDNKGNVTTSASVYIKVTSASSSTAAYPNVSITNPIANKKYSSGSMIFIQANASVSSGSIKRVEFYSGNTLLHSEEAAPFGWAWRNVKAGKYTLTAKAIDNRGNWRKSASVSITVGNISSRSSDTTNSSLSSDTSQLQMASLDKNKIFDFKLFPNPAVNTIKVDVGQLNTNQKANISILNMAGSVVKTVPLVLSARTIEIDISTLKSGMYVLRLAGDNFGTSKKFVKLNN